MEGFRGSPSRLQSPGGRLLACAASPASAIDKRQWEIDNRGMSVRIGLGVPGFPFSSPATFLEWVDLCEESPIDSLWFSERLVSLQTLLEPMTAMAVVAGRTKRLKFGMNAVVLPFRDPLVLAKECATLDFLSDGRLLPAFGVGGDTAPEFPATAGRPRGAGRFRTKCSRS